jgi:hypothetical protein
MVGYDEFVQDEFDDFYDFSSSYPDYDPNNPVCGQRTNEWTLTVPLCVYLCALVGEMRRRGVMGQSCAPQEQREMEVGRDGMRIGEDGSLILPDGKALGHREMKRCVGVPCRLSVQ